MKMVATAEKMGTCFLVQRKYFDKHVLLTFKNSFTDVGPQPQWSKPGITITSTSEENDTTLFEDSYICQRNGCMLLGANSYKILGTIILCSEITVLQDLTPHQVPPILNSKGTIYA